MSYAYGGDPTGLSGSYHFGGGGLGVLGSLVPSTGEHGGGYGSKSLSLPADADKEYFFPLGTIPAGLTIVADEDSGFTASANDGTYVVPFSVVENGSNIGSSTFTLVFGAPTVNLVGTTSTQAATSGTGAVTVTPPAPGVINLAGSSCVQAATSGTGAATINRNITLVGANCAQAATSSAGSVTVTSPVPNVVNLAGSNSAQHAASSVGAITIATGGTIPDASTISASRTVNFGGGTNRVNFGGGTNRVNF
jgi:hypothetical protein